MQTKCCKSDVTTLEGTSQDGGMSHYMEETSCIKETVVSIMFQAGCGVSGRCLEMIPLAKLHLHCRMIQQGVTGYLFAAKERKEETSCQTTFLIVSI